MTTAAEERIMNIKAVSKRLLYGLLGLLVVLGVLFMVALYPNIFKVKLSPTLPAVLIFGALGAFVSLQRRLKKLPDEDLTLIRLSLPYTWLAPMTGALLAGVLYLLFISHLLVGDLFPKFHRDVQYCGDTGFLKLFHISCNNAADYAKLLFWCFVAGFSERFVTDIIGRFQSHNGGIQK